MNNQKSSLAGALRSALHRYQFLILAIGVVVFGIFLIAAPESSPFPQVARDLGVAFLAAGTVGLALEFYTRRQFRDLVTEDLRSAVDSSSLASRLEEMLSLASLGGDLRELGVRRIHRNRNAIDFSRLIEEAEPGSELRLLGVCLAGFMDRQTQVLIEKKLRDRCSVRILILDPESDFVKLRAIEENRTYDDIKKDISGAAEIHANFIENRVAQAVRSQIRLGRYDAAPAYFIFSTHNTMVVGFYLREDLGEFFPQLELEIKEGGIYRSFDQHFESLWRTCQASEATTISAPSA